MMDVRFPVPPVLAYEVEGIAPLAAGQVIEDIRTDKANELLNHLYAQLSSKSITLLDIFPIAMSRLEKSAAFSGCS